jgi:hypothetical protein
MSIEEIPRSFKYVCDRCGQEHIQENAGGHYTESTPPEWSTFKFWLATPPRAWSASVLLCEACTKAFAAVLRDFKIDNAG